MMIDGTNLIKHPADEMGKIQKFLQIPAEIDENSFDFDEERGFYCFGRCMGDGKGRTKGVNFEPELHDKLAKFYEPFNRLTKVSYDFTSSHLRQ